VRGDIFIMCMFYCICCFILCLSLVLLAEKFLYIGCGNDAEIVLIGREAGSGTRDGFEDITDTKDKCDYRQELTSTGDVITTVASSSASFLASSPTRLAYSLPARTLRLYGIIFP